MTAPTFIAEAELVWNTGDSPKTTGSLSVQTNDILVAFAIISDATPTFSTPTNSGTAFNWGTPLQEVAVSAYCRMAIWAATATATQSCTVTLTKSASAEQWGGNVFLIRESSGIGASNKANSSGTATLGLTTTQANSLIVVTIADWNAVDGSGRGWLTTDAGAFTEQSYYFGSSVYTVYGGYHADAGSVGAKTLGLTNVTGQKYSIIALEVKGTAGGGRTTRNPRSHPLGLAYGLGLRIGGVG